ncbi:MAG: cytochrome ubiquinol oxidase subunit I, partial [Actinophytocola sp.]
ETTTADDPWGYGNSLEWATTTPPPRHNFLEMPRIRSERPAFDLHYPHAIDEAHRDKYVGPFSGKHKETVPPAPSEKLSEAMGGDDVNKG